MERTRAVALGGPSLARRLELTLRPLPFARVYAGLFLVINLVLLALPDSWRAAVDLATSTNVARLATDPLFVLPASAFVDEGQLWLWIPLILLLVGGLESHIGTRRAVLAVFGAHTVATLLSEGILLTRVALHLEPISQLHIIDIGPSYMVLAALAGCLVVGGIRLKLGALAVGAFILPGLLHGLTSLDMTAVGHVSALVLGATFAVVLTRRFTLRTDRLRLLAGSLVAGVVWTRLTWGRPLAYTDPSYTSTITGTSMGRRRYVSLTHLPTTRRSARRSAAGSATPSASVASSA